MKYKIEQLKSANDAVVDQIKRLTALLGEGNRPLSGDDIESMLNSSCNFFFVAKNPEGKIVAMATLIVYRIPYVKKSIIEDVVVDKDSRGQGIGTNLISVLIKKAKAENVSYIDLTSRPSRQEGNKLYEKLGFKKRDTNVYRLTTDNIIE